VTGEYQDTLANITAKASVAVAAWLQGALESPDGSSIPPTPANREAVSKLAAKFVSEMNRRSLGALNKWFSGQMPGQMVHFQEALEAINQSLQNPLPEVKFGQLDQDALNQVVLTTRDQLDGVVQDVGNLAQRKTMMRLGVGSHKDITDELVNTFHTTIPKAMTLADTSMSIYRRTITDRAVGVIEAGGRKVVFMYAGPRDKLTRPFCRHLLENPDARYTREDIEKMDNRQLPNPFLTGGGYNCRHQWLMADYKEAPKPAQVEPPKPAYQNLDEEAEEELAVVSQVGQQGESIRVDTTSVEDQNALVFEQQYKGKTETVIRMKLQPDAEADLVRDLARQASPAANDPKPLPTLPMEEDYPALRDAFLQAMRSGQDMTSLVTPQTFGAGAEGQALYETAMEQYNLALREMSPAVSVPKSNWSNNALEQAFYQGWGPERWTFYDGTKLTPERVAGVQEELAAVRAKQRLEAQREFQAREAALKPKAEVAEEGDGLTITRGPIRLDKRKVVKGGIEVVERDVPLNVGFGVSDPGEAYLVRGKDGLTIRYTPWSGNSYYALKGYLEVSAPGSATPALVDELLTRVTGLSGVQTRVAATADQEWMYLQKHAYMLKLDNQPGWAAVCRAATVEERVAKGREFWAKRLGVSDVTKLPDYDPAGVQATAFRDDSLRAGVRNQYRFDMSQKDLEQSMPGYGLYHSVTQGGGVAQFVEAAMGGNGAMAATVEKIRVGIPVGGLSPESDLGTGGGNYVFTRIQANPSESGVVFKANLLRRLDAISYDGDKYGRVTDDYVRRNRHFTVSGWKDQCATSSTNETILKGTLSLLDDVDYFIVRSQAEKDQIIKAFRDSGHPKMGDGRKIEDCVKIKAGGH
jgi:hypothetical protein